MRKVTEDSPEEKKYPHADLLARLPLGLLTDIESAINPRYAELKKSLRYLIPLRTQIKALSKDIAMIDQHMKDGTPVPNLKNKPYDEYHRLIDLRNKIQGNINSAKMNNAIFEHDEYKDLKTAIAEAKHHAQSSTADIPPEVSVDLLFMFTDVAMPAVSESITKVEEDISNEAQSHDSLIHAQVISDEEFQNYLYDSKNSLMDLVSQAYVLFDRKLYTKSLEPLNDAVLKLEEEVLWMRDYIFVNRFQLNDTLYATAYKYQLELEVKLNVLKHTQEYFMSKTPIAKQEEKVQRRDSLRIQKSEDRKLGSDSQPDSPALTRTKMPLLRRLSDALLRKKASSSSESSSPSDTPKGSPATVRKKDTPVVEGFKETARDLSGKQEAKEESSHAESHSEAIPTSKTPPGSPKGGQG